MNDRAGLASAAVILLIAFSMLAVGYSIYFADRFSKSIDRTLIRSSGEQGTLL